MTRGSGESPRPATILSEFGEGYCRTCRFVVGLTEDGLIADHVRGQVMNWENDRRLCKGSGGRPPKVTPYSSTKARFRVTAEKVVCPVCLREVPLNGDRVISRHTAAMIAREVCKGSYQKPK